MANLPYLGKEHFPDIWTWSTLLSVAFVLEKVLPNKQVPRERVSISRPPWLAYKHMVTSQSCGFEGSYGFLGLVLPFSGVSRETKRTTTISGVYTNAHTQMASGKRNHPRTGPSKFLTRSLPSLESDRFNP